MRTLCAMPSLPSAGLAIPRAPTISSSVAGGSVGSIAARWVLITSGVASMTGGGVASGGFPPNSRKLPATSNGADPTSAIPSRKIDLPSLMPPVDTSCAPVSPVAPASACDPTSLPDAVRTVLTPTFSPALNAVCTGFMNLPANPADTASKIPTATPRLMANSRAVASFAGSLKNCLMDSGLVASIPASSIDSIMELPYSASADPDPAPTAAPTAAPIGTVAGDATPPVGADVTAPPIEPPAIPSAILGTI